MISVANPARPTVAPGYPTTRPVPARVRRRRDGPHLLPVPGSRILLRSRLLLGNRLPATKLLGPRPRAPKPRGPRPRRARPRRARLRSAGSRKARRPRSSVDRTGRRIPGRQQLRRRRHRPRRPDLPRVARLRNPPRVARLRRPGWRRRAARRHRVEADRRARVARATVSDSSIVRRAAVVEGCGCGARPHCCWSSRSSVA